MKNIIVLLFLFTSGVVDAQVSSISDRQKVEALNIYVDFINESIHGMLIIHRLLENYNQDINQYVDLEGTQINFYSNADIPFNIFEDPDHWFYDTSPAALAKEFKNTPLKVYPGLMEIMAKVTRITNETNEIRFKVENTIKTNDLNNTENLVKVYELLERGVTLYDQLYEQVVSAKTVLEKASSSSMSGLSAKNRAIYDHLNMIHTAVWDILVALREKDDLDFDQKLLAHEKAGKNFNRLMNTMSSIDNRTVRSTKKINDAYQKSYSSAKRFYEIADVDQDYKLYGKYYFYHNSDIINKFNRYGSGYVFEMNQWISRKEEAFLKFMEMPHYYQVIYPKKLEKLDAIASTDNKIEAIPKKLKDRDVISNRRTIEVDTTLIELKIYDHMIQDGDIVSINFNGDWILESYSLEAKPVNLKLKLNNDGKNYLLLHAESVGKRPPNTVGISYTYKGEEHKIMMKSDMQASEMIEIKLNK